MSYRVDNNLLQPSYNQFFQERIFLDSDSSYRWYVSKLNARSGKVLLDIACGTGSISIHAKQIGLKPIGLDFSEEAIKIQKTIDSVGQFIIADGQDIPLPDNFADYITCLGSLEHYIDIDKGIQEIHRVLRDDGTAAILLPNAYYLVDLVWLVWRKGQSPSHKQPIERFAASADWRALLKKNGLNVVKTHKYNFIFPRSCLDFKFYLKHPKKLLNAVIAPFVPFNFSFSFLYLCTKKNPSESK